MRYRPSRPGQRLPYGGPPLSPALFQYLIYNNPFRQKVDFGWYDHRPVYYLDLGRVFLAPARPDQTANIYVFIRGVDNQGNPVLLAQQKMIMDSVPGTPGYSPLWRVNYVLAPASYPPNAIRSLDDLRRSGFRVHPSDLVINAPVL